MPSWSRFASGERKSVGSILPITNRDDDDDDIDVKYHSKPSPPPPPRRKSSTPQQSLGMRRWLCERFLCVRWGRLLLLANIVAVLFFILASAFYFPPVVSDSVVRQALAQGDPGFQRQEELESAAPTTELTAETKFAGIETENGGGGTSEAPSVTQAPEDQLKPLGDVQEPASLLGNKELTLTSQPEGAKQEPSPTVESVSETQVLVIQAAVATVDATTTTEPMQKEIDSLVAKNSADTNQDDQKTHLQPPNSIADLIAKMKERRANNADAIVTPEEETVSVLPIEQQQQQDGKQSTLVPTEDQVDSTKRDENGEVPVAALKKNLDAGKTKNWEPLDEDAIRKNLLVWLSADKGVEVENLSECQATGDSNSCDVKVWTSQVTAAAQTTTEAFTPATSDQARPTFISNIYNRNELPALFFSCPLANENIKLHEYMTLFFVLSPAQIEVANPYKAQKFFGNAPYGQFFFHSGKPGFLSNGGVRELDEKASSGNFYLLTYRLQRNSAEIKMNRQQWGGSTADANGEDTPFAVRMSDNAALSLGNVKAMCDTNAFQGRIAEVMIYDTILTDERVSEVETYLERKWWDKPFETSASIDLDKPPAKVDNQRPDEQSPDDGNAAPEPELNDDPDKAEPQDQANDEGDTTTESPPDGENPQANENGDTTNEEQQEQISISSSPAMDATERSPPTEPITFNPEDVFEWTPPEAVLALKQSAQDLVGEWKRHVREKIEAIRGFRMGGEVLRAFIRNRKDELIALRQELFG